MPGDNPFNNADKKRSYKEVLYSDIPLEGEVCNFYKLGVNKNSGQVYYKDPDCNWQPISSSGGGGLAEIIPIDDEDSKIITWTPTRQLNFGDFPVTEVWIIDDGDGLLHKFESQPSIDAIPPLFTTMTFTFTGNVTGFIVLK